MSECFLQKAKTVLLDVFLLACYRHDLLDALCLGSGESVPGLCEEGGCLSGQGVGYW